MGCKAGFRRFSREGVVISPSCESTAPTPYAEASTWRKNFFSKFGWIRTGASHISPFRRSKASCCVLVHSQGVVFFVRCNSGHEICE